MDYSFFIELVTIISDNKNGHCLILVSKEFGASRAGGGFCLGTGVPRQRDGVVRPDHTYVGTRLHTGRAE